VSTGQRIVHPTGLSQSNVGSAEDLDWLAEQAGEERKDYLIDLEVDKVNKLVQIKVTKTEASGVQRVARSSDGRTLSFSLGGLFKQYRSVALKQKRQCPAFLDRENQRMILSLQAPKAKRKTAARGGSAAKAKSAAKAAAQQEAPDTDE
jgi:hypothetical protein